MLMLFILAVAADQTFFITVLVQACQIQGLVMGLAGQVVLQIFLHFLYIFIAPYISFTSYSFIILSKTTASIPNPTNPHICLYNPKNIHNNITVIYQKMTSQVISLINAARTNPDRTGASLYESLKQTFKGNDMNAFNKVVETFQGIKAVEDFHMYMHSLHPVSNLVESPTLNRVAGEIAREKGQKGQVTQQHPRTINQKIEKTSKVVGKVGELISLRTNSPQETVSYLLIDDGLMSRKRRRMLLDPQYRYIGVGQAKHSLYGSIVVVLLAENIQN